VSQPLLEIEKVSKRFGGIEAVGDVSFSVAPGEIVGLIGPNGAGKTTLFNLVSGLQRLSSGEIRFQGQRISGRRPDQICRAGIGRTFQTTSLIAGMSAFDNVLLAARFRARPASGHGDARAETLAALELCNLADRAAALSEELTVSEQKRVEIARALATGPRLIMTDEVVAGLNGTETDEVLAILRRIAATGISLVFVEHDMRAVMAVSQRLIVLARGRLLAEGPPAEVAKRPDVISVYLGHRYAERH
jgi:branched-chain amino acid transport system ATP-binding protein